MNPPASELIPIGLAITAIGMSMVFAALALLWVLIRVITSVFADKEEPQPELSMAIEEADAADAQAALEAAECSPMRSRCSSRRPPAPRSNTAAARRPG